MRGSPLPARVVMLGGGYVTLHAYAALARRLRGDLRPGRVEVVIISADEAHSFHGFTGEVLAGQLPLAVTRTPVQEACPLARFVHGTVTEVDLRAQVVRAELATGAQVEVGYDRLVVGLGSREPVASVPGLAEHGFTLRGPGDIAALDRHLQALCSGPGPHGRAQRTVVVAGGGLAGAEMAAAVAGRRDGGFRVILVQPHEQVLPHLEPFASLRGTAGEELGRLGVEIRQGARVTEVGREHVMLSTGERIEAATVLGAIGQEPVPLRGLERLPHDRQGRLMTSPELRVAPRVWAAGDAARVLHPVTGRPVPANALWAIKAGEHIGANLARSLRGADTRRFRYRGLGQAASFGRGHAIAELYGIPLTGWAAWLLRLAFFVRFMPSRRRAVQAVAYAVRPPAPAAHPSAVAGESRGGAPIDSPAAA
jgi:NADH:ubiquinone reductase (H+-translocating)